MGKPMFLRPDRLVVGAHVKTMRVDDRSGHDPVMVKLIDMLGPAPACETPVLLLCPARDGGVLVRWVVQS